MIDDNLRRRDFLGGILGVGMVTTVPLMDIPINKPKEEEGIKCEKCGHFYKTFGAMLTNPVHCQKCGSILTDSTFVQYNKPMETC